jgi:mRNA interferase RelE/StbE
MGFEIKFSNQATKFFRQLQQDIQDRIKQKFHEVSEDPFRFLEHFEGDYYKLRIGDYRALIDIDLQRKILFIRILDKRGRIYK